LLDIHKVEEELRKLFRDIHGDPEVDVIDAEDITPGWEARIVGFRLIKGKHSTEMVARIYNDVDAGSSAEREFNVMHSLAKVGYPAAEVYLLCTEKKPLGAPFVIMEKLPGGSLMNAFIGKPDQQPRVLEVFSKLYVDLHKLPPRGALPFKRRYRSTQGRLTSLLAGYDDLFRGEGFTGLLPALLWLKSHQKKVSNTPLAVIHGDFHPGNVLLRRDGSYAVVDWTQADVGDYREDVAWTKILASTILDPGLGDAFVTGYSRAAGRGIIDLGYFEVLALVRRLVIFLDVTKYQGGLIESRNESSGLKLDQRQHYLKVLSRLVALTGLKLPEIQRLLS
jgi:aminoglycoside phosphotransferase (APT) family kinase protein